MRHGPRAGTARCRTRAWWEAQRARVAERDAQPVPYAPRPAPPGQERLPAPHRRRQSPPPASPGVGRRGCGVSVTGIAGAAPCAECQPEPPCPLPVVLRRTAERLEGGGVIATPRAP